MNVKRWNFVCAVGVLLVTMLACKFSFTTANLSSLKISKDKAARSTTSSFAPPDTIYAVADVSNAPGKMKLKGRLLFDKVEGQSSGAAVPGAETTIDMPGSGIGTFTFTPPASGWPNGSYKVEVSLINEDGEQKDQKTDTFSVSGGRTTATTPSTAPSNRNSRQSSTDEDDDNSAAEGGNDNHDH